MRIGIRTGETLMAQFALHQPPSDRNALGHSTSISQTASSCTNMIRPTSSFFEKVVRAYSHGCMRVEKPDKYAEVLLSISQPEDRYSVQRIRSLYGASERDVNLKNPIPVYLTYQTAFVDEAGQLETRLDIYGLDQATNHLLKGYVTRRRPISL